MCIRDRSEKLSAQDLVAEIDVCFKAFDAILTRYDVEKIKTIGDAYMACLLYTSDAADERSSVDLGGRRIIKKKQKITKKKKQRKMNTKHERIIYAEVTQETLSHMDKFRTIDKEYTRSK